MVIGIATRGVAANRASSRAKQHRRSGPHTTRGRPEQSEHDPAEELPRSILRAAGLTGYCCDAVALAPPARATAAARAFAAGNGYLPGLIVDRLA